MRLAAVLPILLLTSVACVGHKIGPVDGADAGPGNAIQCNAAADCPTDTPQCSGGICKRPCAADDACNDASTYCNVVDGFCETGCRDSSTCGTGKVCSAGACIASTGCGSNCDCAVGQVCSNGACTAPPAQCHNSDDCPKGPTTCAQYSCNGFTNQCFDPNPTACHSDADCTGTLGCESGCTCVTDSGTCATSVQCTPQNESTTCGAGFYCASGNCQAAPTCSATDSSGCTAAGLVCNTGTGQCVRSQTCATSADCTTAPNTFCTTSSTCGIALCNNGGPTCPSGQTCTTDGRCVTQGTGGPCTANADCQANEYCALVNGSGQCAVGCRDNTGCPSGQSCNGSNQCVGGGNGSPAGWQQTCSTTSDCASGLFCGTFTHVCQESCSTTGPCTGGSCCTLSGAQCCTNAIVNICSNTGC